MKPLFSVIIPSYNRAHILPQAINSVLFQTYSNWELFIVDDGSTDNTEIVMNSFIDTRINYLKKDNGGVCSARNHGVNFSKGEYIVFLDSDDNVTEKWLENFNNFINIVSKPDIVCGGIKRIDTISKITSLVECVNHGKGGNGWAVVIPGAFAVKKDFFIQCGMYDEVVKYAENTELFIRFEFHKPIISYTNCFDLLYYPSVDGGSKNHKNILESAKYMLQKHKLWFDNSPENKFIYINIIAVKASLLRENKLAFQYFFLALKMKPFYSKTYYRIFKLIFKRN